MLKKSDYVERLSPNSNPVYVNGKLLSDIVGSSDSLFVADTVEEFPAQGKLEALYIATTENKGNGCLYRWCTVDNCYKELTDSSAIELAEKAIEATKEINKTVTEYGNSMTTVTETIKVIEEKITPDEIERLMSSKFVSQSEFDEMEIGGRNLLYRTNQGDHGWSTIETNGSYTVEGKTFLEQDGVIISCQEMSIGTAAILRDVPEGTYNNLSPGCSYVISMDTNGVDLDLSDIMCEDCTKGLVSTKRKISTVTDYGLHIKYYIKLRSAGEYSPYANQKLYFDNPLYGGQSVQIVNLKLEKGTNSTGWSPAPEDVKSDTQEIIEKFTDIKQTVDGFERTISKTTTKIESGDGEVYAHIKYSMNENGDPFYHNASDLSEEPLYIGVCYTSTSSSPTDPSKYTWILIKSKQGIPGPPGTSYYLHIKYSNDGLSFSANDGEEIGPYMGTCVDENPKDPLIFDKYTWKKVDAKDGQDGKDAVVLTIDSSKGTVFKKDMRTDLTLTITSGSNIITDINTLKNTLGDGCYIQWTCKKQDDEDFTTISNTIEGMEGEGFKFTVTSDFVKDKVVLRCLVMNNGLCIAAAHITLYDSADSYSVRFTKDSYTFLGTSTCAVPGSCTTQIIAYKGNTQVSAYIVESEIELPEGVSLVVVDNTTAPIIKISVSEEVTESGSFTIPVHIEDDIVLDKDFSYSISLKGEDGTSPFTVIITSSKGSIFKNGIIDTTLKVKLLYGSEDVTNNFDDACFIWSRVSDDEKADQVWNDEHFGGSKEINITKEDVYSRATFFCDVYDTQTQTYLVYNER